MTKERFLAANAIALITHTIAQPFDLIKIRSQMLQEGKTFIGIGMQRGWYPMEIGQEILNAGGGLKKFYSSIDAFLIRTLTYTTARTWSFLYFYDWINPDPRRQARPDYYAAAGLAGGAIAGIVTNPVEIVFARMQVDEMYPEIARRNYKHFFDGLFRVS